MTYFLQKKMKKKLMKEKKKNNVQKMIKIIFYFSIKKNTVAMIQTN